MRVLEIVGSINGGGSGKIVLDYCKHINKVGMDIDILVPHLTHHEKQFFHDEFLKHGCKVIYIEGRKEGLLRHLKKYRAILKNGNYDIVHCHEGCWSFPYLLIAKSIGISVRIAHSHNAQSDRKGISKLIASGMKLLLPLVSSHRYACGREAGRYLWGDRDFRIMRNAIDCDVFRFNEEQRKKTRDSLNISDECKVIIHIARFTYQKNNEFSFEIGKALNKLGLNYKFLFVGEGPLLEEIEKSAKSSGDDRNYMYLGLRDDVPELLMAADCFVLPSRFEGLPIVAVEAQASGIPVVLSDRITDEVIITDNVSVISIDQGVEPWVKTIISDFELHYNREEYCEVVKKAGYDIEKQSDLLKLEYSTYLDQK